MKDDGLGNIPYDIRLDLAQSKAREDLAKLTRSWGRDYDYGKSDKVMVSTLIGIALNNAYRERQSVI